MCVNHVCVWVMCVSDVRECVCEWCVNDVCVWMWCVCVNDVWMMWYSEKVWKKWRKICEKKNKSYAPPPIICGHHHLKPLPPRRHRVLILIILHIQSFVLFPFRGKYPDSFMHPGRLPNFEWINPYPWPFPNACEIGSVDQISISSHFHIIIVYDSPYSDVNDMCNTLFSEPRFQRRGGQA